MSEEPLSGRRRSGRSADKARAKALELLKSKHRPELKLDDPIYDTVADDDYERLVAARQESARNFIVDDDGLGYVDEGEEEDWARSALPPSSSDDEHDASRKRRNKVVKRETEVVKKKPPPASSLTAAAALMGKQKLSAMFTSSAFRKNERKNCSGSGSGSIESMVDDIIAEFAPDEKDREERRRRRGVAAVPVASGFRVSELEKGADVGVEVKLRENGEVQIESGEIKVENCEEGKIVDLKNETAAEDNGVVTMDIEMHVGEVNVEPMSEKKVPSSTLNARIKTEKDVNMVSATDGWKALCEDGGRGSIKPEVGGGESANSDENSEFVLDSDGSLPFYLIDVHEESYGANSGTLYLFGKVKTGTTYQSCCIVVKNMQRCIYAIPKSTVFQSAEISNLEKEHTSSSISRGAFRTKLQEMSSDLKSEIAEVLVDHNISSFTMTPVKRGYAFERVDIPMGEQYVLKISYPFKDPSLPSDLTGDLFYALFGTNTSALELFLVKRKINGPSWLSISRFSVSPPHERVSWCKYEMVVDFPKDIRVSTPKKVLEIPTVTVTAINLKTIINQKKNVSEIVSASVICCRQVKIDGPMIVSECERPGILSYFSIIRKLEGGIFPMGFDKQVADRNSKAGSKVLAMESSERALLNRLMIELHKLDSDVLVGHNISGFDLDVLLHRSQACTVPSSMWSKIGRLKRSIMPKLTKGNTLYGSGASHGIISCIAGRLLCDTYLSSRDLVKEVSYSLTQLAKTQLNKDRQEISPHDIPHMFQASGSLLNFVDCGETDAWLSLELMFHLSILPLTRQLTNISGNLWGKTLQGARAQRVEFLLLHAFHAKKYIVPDKSFVRSKAPSSLKRERKSGATCADAEDINTDDAVLDSDPQLLGRVKNKKGPAYIGGLVLEPQKGLYDKIVLLLDFNSLYPSIIQEYNICFTTIERTLDGSAPSLPSSRITGVLPELLKNLVERRRLVKSWLKTATGMMVQQFDIQQQALKLTANSMYGCLGFPYSRFYAKPIAELITLQGREILQSTVDLVQNILNLEVIYGDTDSIMIHSGLDDVIKAKAVATKVIKEVNKKYRCLEIDLDGLYKRMLLLKKKKYAAVKLQFKDGKQHEVIERKGLDMVRRDWSLLSKELGDFCLSQILSGGSCDEVVETIHNYLMEVQKEMRNGEIELEKYVITKTLTKPPEEYPDGKNQPHVQVALRLRQSGYTSGCSAGDTVPYVICYDQGTSSSSSGGIAGRARHPDELKRDNENWTIDIDYYLSQQIHPVVARLCASIQGTSPARLANCLGLDSSKFQTNTESTSKDPSYVLASMLDDDDRYHGCEPLRLSCPSCSSSFDCAPLSSLFSSMSNKKTTDSDNENKSDLNFWQRMRCPRCPEDVEGCKISAAMMANQVKRQAENFISMYYKGVMMCDDEMCKHTTRNLTLRVIGDCERGTVCPNYPRCNGHLIRQYTEAELYKQLSYFCYIFDIKRCDEKMDQNTRFLFEKELTRIQPIISLASSTIKKIRDQSAYGWVRLEDFSVSV